MLKRKCQQQSERVEAPNVSGFPCTLQVLVHKATNDVYAASVDKKIAVKVGPGNWSPQDGGVQIGQKDWTLVTSGPNFAVWDAVF